MASNASVSLVPALPASALLEAAENARRAGTPDQYELAVLSERDLLGIRVTKQPDIVSGVIPYQSIVLINGFRGWGKSWVSTSLANAISWGGQIGPWHVPVAKRVLIVDGEMPIRLLQQRLKALNNGKNIGHKRGDIFIYPDAYAYRIGVRRANLLNPVFREAIIGMLDILNAEVLVLDNLSSLTPGIDENNKLDFDPINSWLLGLRFGGHTIIMNHHTGKSGEQRGTTAHEDHADVSFLLTHPKGYKASQRCRLDMIPQKDRASVTGGLVHTLLLKDDDKGGCEFIIEEKKGRAAAANYIREHPEADYKEVTEKFGISSKTFYRLKEELDKED